MIVFKEILKNINPITYNTQKIPYLIYKIQGKIPGHMNSNNINKKEIHQIKNNKIKLQSLKFIKTI